MTDMKILSVKELDRQLEKDAAQVVAEAERLYMQQVEAAADITGEMIGDKPIVLLSGPSGSGKTTTALLLKQLLEQRGQGACVISLDNYFQPLDHLQQHEKAGIDLESPKRLDMKLLASQMDSFLRCEEVTLPQFSFADQSRREGERFRREKGQAVIIEGIHALNPDVTGAVDDSALCIYVSVRTRLSMGERLLHPEKIRLMRRLMRDRLFRGKSTEEVISAFDSVQLGEQRYIMPYKGAAHIDIDTFMSYEAAVYGYFLLEELEKVSPRFELYDTVLELTDFLKEITPLSPDMIPSGSIIREFVGGSSFSY